MVVFTCNHCGESLQKPKVEKHYAFACRRVKSLTCVDCFKDFREEEYVVHTKCLTEDERYAAKGTYVNGVVKKGEVKQESWVEMVKSILDKESNMKSSCRNILTTISNFSNIPRKKPKFMNFLKSSFGGKINMKDIEDVWNIIEKYKNNQLKIKLENKEDSLENNQNGDDSVNDSKNKENKTMKRKASDEEGVSNNKKNRKIVEEANVSEENQELNKEGKFCFQDKILEILTAKGSTSFKKLKKKVLNAYLKETGKTEVSPKLEKKFERKLKKLTNVQINDDRIILLETN